MLCKIILDWDLMAKSGAALLLCLWRFSLFLYCSYLQVTCAGCQLEACTVRGLLSFHTVQMRVSVLVCWLYPCAVLAVLLQAM
jgi:hypothetical protein